MCLASALTAPLWCSATNSVGNVKECVCRLVSLALIPPPHTLHTRASTPTAAFWFHVLRLLCVTSGSQCSKNDPLPHKHVDTVRERFPSRARLTFFLTQNEDLASTASPTNVLHALCGTGIRLFSSPVSPQDEEEGARLSCRCRARLSRCRFCFCGRVLCSPAHPRGLTRIPPCLPPRTRTGGAHQ